MNGRIRELAGQCESFGLWENKAYTFDKEKFAELIIMECAGFLRDTLDDHFAAEQLEQHFGVEK